MESILACRIQGDHDQYLKRLRSKQTLQVTSVMQSTYIIISFSGGEWRLERHSETCRKATFSARGRSSNPVWHRCHWKPPVLFQIFSDGTNIISRRLLATCWRSCTDSPRSRWRSSTATMTETSISPSRRRGRGCGPTGTSSRWTQSDWILISAPKSCIRIASEGS